VHKKGPLKLEINRYGFFGANIDTDTSAIHVSRADADISKIFKSCFLLHYQKYYAFYISPFFQKV